MKSSGEPEKEFKMKKALNIHRTKLEVEVLAFSAEKPFWVPGNLMVPKKGGSGKLPIGPESRAS